MLNRICSRITKYLVEHGILRQELLEWCIYWLQKRILTCTVVLIMFYIGWSLFGAAITFFYLLGLLPLRRHLLGYHTKSPHTCAALSIIIMLVALLLHDILTNVLLFIYIVLNIPISFLLMMYFLKEQNDPLLHLTEEEMKINNKKALYTFCNVSLIGIVMAFFKGSIEYASASQFGISTVIGASVYAKWKKEERRTDYEDIGNYQKSGNCSDREICIAAKK